MRPISPKFRQIIDKDKYYKVCARLKDGGCAGRITIEHAVIYGGKQIDTLWNFVPICEKHHAVCNYQDRGDFDKEKNVWIALNQATEQELRDISKVVDYIKKREYLNKLYGNYTPRQSSINKQGV